MKWYEKIICCICVLITMPLILFVLLIWAICMPFFAIHNRRLYKKSSYYNDFKIPYSKHILNSNQYNFYNYAKKENLPIKYFKQKNISLDYFIYKNQAFIFPDFSEIKFNDEDKSWVVIYRKYLEESEGLLDEYLNKINDLFKDIIDLPIRILVSRNYFDVEVIDLSSLPECFFVIKKYTSNFIEDYKYNLDIIPKTTEKLYEMMSNNKNLGGEFKLLDNEMIEWKFDEVIYNISMDERDGYFSVLKNNKLKMEITHWHPDEYEIYDEICKIGEKGNVLVIKTFLGSAGVVYMGAKNECPIKKNKFRFCKLYYFESK